MNEMIQRNLAFSISDVPKERKRIDSDYYIEGYALTFDKYELFKFGDEAIYEQIERNALAETDLNDVILQFEHDGFVYARTSNGTLGLSVDNHGLLVYADLSKTQRSRELYEDIRSGMINKMSFKARCDYDFDDSSNTNVIRRIKNLIDVSVVSIPANEGTEIEARCKEAIEKKLTEELKAKTQKRSVLKLKLKLGLGD